VSYHLISIVLPVHNQADHLAGIIRAFESGLERIDPPHELVLVPNGCRDRSPEICCALARFYRAVRMVPADRPGWGLAVKVGLAAARGDLLCFTNSARTSPADLALLLHTACANPNVVIKARRAVRDRSERRIGSFLYGLECRALLGLKTMDVNGTPKIFPRTFDRLLHLTRDDDLLDAEFNAVVTRERYPMIEVPIMSAQRHGGRSTMTYRRAVQLYWGVYQMARAMKANR
jgi:glycosyltransferase involved in cell wall biosynthesis